MRRRSGSAQAAHIPKQSANASIIWKRLEFALDLDSLDELGNGLSAPAQKRGKRRIPERIAFRSLGDHLRRVALMGCQKL